MLTHHKSVARMLTHHKSVESDISLAMPFTPSSSSEEKGTELNEIYISKPLDNAVKRTSSNSTGYTTQLLKLNSPMQRRIRSEPSLADLKNTPLPVAEEKQDPSCWDSIKKNFLFWYPGMNYKKKLIQAVFTTIDTYGARAASTPFFLGVLTTCGLTAPLALTITTEILSDLTGLLAGYLTQMGVGYSFKNFTFFKENIAALWKIINTLFKVQLTLLDTVESHINLTQEEKLKYKTLRSDIYKEIEAHPDILEPTISQHTKKEISEGCASVFNCCPFK